MQNTFNKNFRTITVQMKRSGQQMDLVTDAGVRLSFYEPHILDVAGALGIEAKTGEYNVSESVWDMLGRGSFRTP